MAKTKDQRVTVKDIAREAGVSTALVSFVMCNEYSGGSYRVSPETTKRILDVAKELDYHPNTAAKSLKSGRFNTIGVIISDISNPFFSEIARLIENGAYKRDYTVLFGSTDESSDKLCQLVDVFISKGVDGIIIVPCDGSDSYILQMESKKIPVVLIDRTIPGTRFPSVTLDNAAAARIMTSTLIGKGYRHIEMVSYTMRTSNIKDRESGYASAMADAGLGEFTRINTVEYTSYMDQVENIMNEADERGVEAFVFATNNLATRGMLSIYRRSHGNVDAGGIGIACFDKADIADVYPDGLVYATQPLSMFAGNALDILFGQIDGDTQAKHCGMDTKLSPEIIDTTRQN